MAGKGNKIRLEDGTVGTVIHVNNGNLLILTNKGAKRWIKVKDIKEVVS